MTRPVILYCDDEEIHMPTRWRICGQCEGRGTSSAYLGAFTRDDFEEEGPEFVEDYMAGRYDRACETCEGSGKVLEVDRKKAKAMGLLERWDRQEADDAADRETNRMERLMEGGWREEGW